MIKKYAKNNTKSSKKSVNIPKRSHTKQTIKRQKTLWSIKKTLFFPSLREDFRHFGVSLNQKEILKQEKYTFFAYAHVFAC